MLPALDDFEEDELAQCGLNPRPCVGEAGGVNQRNARFLPRTFGLIADQRSVTFPYKSIFIRACHTPRTRGGIVAFIRGGHTPPAIALHIETIAAVRLTSRLRRRPEVGIE